MGNTEPFDVLGQNFGPFGMNLIGDKQALTLHQGGQVGCFAAWSSSQIKHGFTGLRCQ
ncbi:hypothetical protein D3C76_1634330 [compost metagenome]